MLEQQQGNMQHFIKIKTNEVNIADKTVIGVYLLLMVLHKTHLKFQVIAGKDVSVRGKHGCFQF